MTVTGFFSTAIDHEDEGILGTCCSPAPTLLADDDGRLFGHAVCLDVETFYCENGLEDDDLASHRRDELDVQLVQHKYRQQLDGDLERTGLDPANEQHEER